MQQTVLNCAHRNKPWCYLTWDITLVGMIRDITDYTIQSSSWRDNSCSAGQKFPAVMEYEISLLYSQEPACGLCSKPDKSIPHIHTLSNNIFPFKFRSLERSFLLRVSRLKVCMLFSSLLCVLPTRPILPFLIRFCQYNLVNSKS